jgi:hypothetical protein
MEKKNTYNIQFIELNELNNIKYGKYHYNYKTVDFMFNYKETAIKNLIVFHGRVFTNKSWPIFYKYNYEHPDYNVISISDKLLENARFLHNTMYLYGNKNNYHEIYYDIISFILNLTKNEKSIFFGSCSGAYPAVRYGSLFNGYILCFNGYVNLEKHFFDTYNDKIKKIINDDYIYIDNTDIIIKNNPKHILLYINKNDTITFDLNKKFILFCKNHMPNNISYIIHDTIIENRDPHDIHFPIEENFDSILNKF